MIKVSNTEKSSVPVNEMSVAFNITSSSTDYQEALTNLNTKIDILLNDLSKLSFEHEVRVASYTLRKVYDKNNEFLEYRGNALIQLDSDYNENNTLELIELLNSSESGASFTFSFTNSNIATLRNALIDSAYNGALVKANILAKSSNQEIKGVKEASLRDNHYPTPLRAYSEIQLVPQEINLQVTVDVEYET
ncbi:SIMPL domain-containing protein [Mycoplasmatota bacterium]|nr:SIMPL domain-containing protein [Mycoplasmatota bacterium]